MNWRDSTRQQLRKVERERENIHIEHMSSWRLVEAEVESTSTSSPHQESGYGRRGGRTPGGGYRRGSPGSHRGRGGGRYQVMYSMPEVSESDMTFFAYLTAQQIENIFSRDRLSADTYLRYYMDYEGFVPILLLFQYPEVQCQGATVEGVKKRLLEIPTFEIDEVNDTMRLRENWEMVSCFVGISSPLSSLISLKKVNIMLNVSLV